MKTGAICRGATTILLVVQISAISSPAIPDLSLTTSAASIIAAADPTNSSKALNATDKNTPTSTARSRSSRKTPLYLPVTTAPPDIIGIANISGVYGPGAWAAWFLTLVAAWWRILLASEEKYDPNTWAFLFGCNWAAIDVLKNIGATVLSKEATSKYGALGAAFTVLFWGIIHGVCQFCITVPAFKHHEGRNRRLRTLAIGLVLPLITLQAVSIHIARSHDKDYVFIPGLYWYGMTKGVHDLILVVASWTPIIVVLPALLVFLYFDDSFAPPLTAVVRAITDGIIENRLFSDLAGIWMQVGLFLWFPSFILAWATKNNIWLLGALPILSVIVSILISFLPMFWVVSQPILCVTYILKGYLHFGSNISGSCYFMPCAPQSIHDSDQLYALLFGLLSLVGFEVLPHIYKAVKARSQRRQEFVASLEEMARRLRGREMGRTATPGLTRRNTPGTFV